MSVALGAGDGTFGAPTGYVVPHITEPTGTAAVDVNGDGFPDLAVLTSQGGGPSQLPDVGIAWLLNAGDGTFGAPVAMPLPMLSMGISMTATDLDGDGLEDLLITGGHELLCSGARATASTSTTSAR